jgi:thioredoxin 1
MVVAFLRFFAVLEAVSDATFPPECVELAGRPRKGAGGTHRALASPRTDSNRPGKLVVNRAQRKDSQQMLEGSQNLPSTRSSSERIQTVTGRTFARLVLEADGPIAVEFMSYGCAHCRAIEPVLQSVAEMVKAHEKLYRVNVAVEQELAATYEVRGTPTLIMFLNGTEA